MRRSSDFSDRPEFSDWAYDSGSALNENCELMTPLWGSVPWEEVSSFVYLIISEPAVGSSLLGQVGVINFLINGFVGHPIVFSVAPNFGPFYFSDLINDQMGIVETAGTRNRAPIVINLLEAEFQIEIIQVDQLEIRRMFPIIFVYTSLQALKLRFIQ